MVNRGFSINGYLPHESFSSNVEGVIVAGFKWYPEDDKLALGITELNF